MKGKRILTILCVVILAFLLWKTMVGIIFLAPREEYTKEIIPLGIGLFLIAILGGAFDQKNWRMGCLMVGASKILIYFGTITVRELSIFLYLLSLVVILIGFINLNYFYKSDFEPQFKSKPSVKNLIFPVLFLLLVLIIFLIFGRSG